MELDSRMFRRPEFANIGWVTRHVYLSLMMVSDEMGLDGEFLGPYAEAEWLAEVIGAQEDERDILESAMDHLNTEKLLVYVGDGTDNPGFILPAIHPKKQPRKRRVVAVKAPRVQDPNEPPEFTGQSLADLWNANAHVALPRIMTLEGKRAIQADARAKEPVPIPGVGHEDYWKTVIGLLAENPWFLGQNDSKWRASFDYIITPGKASKLVEGALAKSGNAIGTITVAPGDVLYGGEGKQ